MNKERKNSRTVRIAKGKVWVVYKNGQKTIRYEGKSRSSSLNFVRKEYGMKSFKNGSVRIAQVIYEAK